MTSLSRGANAPLDERRFTASVSGPSAGTCDLMVFQVTESGRVRTDDDFVFFNNPVAPGGAVRLVGADAVEVDLGAVPADVHTLRLAVVLDESAPGTLADIGGLSVSIGALDMPAEGLTTERAAVLTEIYRRNDAWKVRNVSAGWDAGFTALVTEHGVSVDDATASPPPPSPPVVIPPSSTPPPASPPVDLAKITLTKSAPTISLAKARDRPSGTMRINLNWSRGAAKGGLFRKQSGGIDLDLGCLYELADGSKGVVQALGNSFGGLTGPPWIALDGDDRSGTVSGGENLLIDLSHIAEFRRILVFAFIYEGTPNWSTADGVVTLFPPGPAGGGPHAAAEVEVRLDSADNSAMSCAIAMLEVRDGDLSITREVRYINGGQRELDEAYGWGMRWSRGSK